MNEIENSQAMFCGGRKIRLSIAKPDDKGPSRKLRTCFVGREPECLQLPNEQFRIDFVVLRDELKAEKRNQRGPEV
jgi:hypothetical protein